MGRDKAGIDWRGRPLGEHQAATLALSGAWPLLLASRPEQPWTPPRFQRLEDRTADGGALQAFADALAHAPARVVTVLAVDLPLIPPAFLERLTGRAREQECSVVPAHHGRFEPFAAAWHRSALPALRIGLASGQSLHELCAALQAQGALQAHPLSAEESACFVNVNTPEALARARETAESGMRMAE
jgi:molybdopterin-guanine dinucleotide biosynthesis protein A